MCLLLLAIGGGYLGWNNLLAAGSEIYIDGGTVALVVLVLAIMVL